MECCLTFLTFVLPTLCAQGAEEVQASHILVMTPDEANVVRNAIMENGGDHEAFVQAARKHSKDATTKRVGGTLGWLTRERATEEFTEAAFALKPGEISHPIQSRRGWHLIFCERRRKQDPRKDGQGIRCWFSPPDKGPGIPDSPPAQTRPIVKIKTVRGEITAELFEGEAPNTVANFIQLVERGYFNSDPDRKESQSFYSVFPGDALVGGSPTNDSSGGPGYRIQSETVANRHRHRHDRGTLTMLLEMHPATGLPVPDSAGSQFMICLRDVAAWDGMYTPFGHVKEGLDVLDKIREGDAIESILIVSKLNRRFKARTLPLGTSPPK